ncbi:MAG: class I SAM-dependent methyltransferase [Saccharofermentans sp.]|nr:class I SAM-dependent methyltransferase [Saccharofermentans sp.]
MLADNSINDIDIKKVYADKWSRSSEFFYQRGYYQRFAKPLEERNLILEIGCGCGFSTLSLAECGHNILAVDNNTHCIDLASELIINKGFSDRVGFLEMDVTNSQAFEELAEGYKYDAVVCWNIGTVYDKNIKVDDNISEEENRRIIVEEYRLKVLAYSCALAQYKEVPFQIVDRTEQKLNDSELDYYRKIGKNFGYNQIDYSYFEGESLSSDGVALMTNGVINDAPVVSLVFNIINLNP